MSANTKTQLNPCAAFNGTLLADPSLKAEPRLARTIRLPAVNLRVGACSHIFRIAAKEFKERAAKLAQ